MSTKIYSHYYKKLDYAVGHLDDKAIVYSDSEHEVGYSVGHVDEYGKVYSHPNAKVGYCVGHMDNNGRIYNHPDAEVGYCVGHVDEKGVIYCHSDLELDYEIGHVEGPLRKKAAAAFLLLLYDASQDEQANQRSQNTTQNTTQNTQRQQEQRWQEQQRQQQPKQTYKPNIKPPSGDGAIVVYLIAALVIFFVFAFGMAILMAFPGLIFGIVGLFGIAKASKENPDSFNVSPDMREACKSDAGATALIWSVVPVGFGIFSACIGGLAYGIWGILAIVAPVIIFYIAMQKTYYIKNLKKAVNGEFQIKPKTNYSQPNFNNQRQNNSYGQYNARPNNGYYNNGQNNTQYNNQNNNNVRYGNTANGGQTVIINCKNPNCRTRCSLPTGQGDILVTCPVCGYKFNART